MVAKRKDRALKYLAQGVNDFQPGSGGTVLKNRLGITSEKEMEDAELAAYLSAEEDLVGRFTADHSFTLEDVHEIHRTFLGGIYDWAGRERNVNMSKGGFPFASARVLPQVLREFETRFLRTRTPCRSDNQEEIAISIAEVHAELLIIHPYREGNGRTARLLATLMAYQAGLPGLGFDYIGSAGVAFDAYIAAIHAGHAGDYEPMKRIILRAIKRASNRNA